MADGKVEEHRVELELLGLMQQLEAIPERGHEKEASSTWCRTSPAPLCTGVHGKSVFSEGRRKMCNKSILRLRGISMGMYPACRPVTATSGLVAGVHGWQRHKHARCSRKGQWEHRRIGGSLYGTLLFTFVV